MNNIDIALVRPWSPSAVPPDALVEDSLGIGYLSSFLRSKDINVVVIDAFTMGFSDEEVIACIEELMPKVIAISLHSFADYKHFVKISAGTRESLPSSYQVVGGEHATFLANEILEANPSVDSVVRSEGELTLLEITQTVLRGEIPESIMGAVIRRDDGCLIDGGFRPAIEDLDAIPRPHKDVIDMALRLGRPAAVSLLSGRGCTHKCTFCTANTYLRLGGGKVWRRRSPKEVADEFQWLAETYIGKPHIHPMIQFQDVIFLGTSRQSKRWTEGFVDELEQRSLKVPYYFMSRADAIIANQHVLPRLADSGLVSVEVGIETGVDRILEAYSKRNSRAGTLEAIGLLQAHNICYDASGFIMFDPDVTLEELRENAPFLRDLGHATWDRYVTRLQVFPGTAIKNELIEKELYDPNPALDDVYAYNFRDSRVAELVKYVSMYDVSIHRLNNLIRQGRAQIAKQRLEEEANTKELQHLIKQSQHIYCEHFLTLIKLVENGTIAEYFEAQIADLLSQVKVMEANFHDVFPRVLHPKVA